MTLKSTSSCPHNTQVNLGQSHAVDFVNTCENLSIDDLRIKLSANISSLENSIKSTALEDLKTYVRIVYKGFYTKSERAQALKYFYMGYHIRKQEELLQKAESTHLQATINSIASTKHFSRIMAFLYENGCSQQKTIVDALSINKSNLTKKMHSLVSCGLVSKTGGLKYVFYELTPRGYLYCKQNNISNNSSDNISKKQLQIAKDATQLHKELLHTSLDEPQILEYTNAEHITEIKKQTENEPVAQTCIVMLSLIPSLSSRHANNDGHPENAQYGALHTNIPSDPPLSQYL